MSQEEKIAYIIDEDSYLNYIIKISNDRTMVSHLLFSEKGENINNLSKSLLCEYFGALRHFENILEKMVDNAFDKETKTHIVPEADALIFTVYLEGLVALKEALLSQNYSLSLH